MTLARLVLDTDREAVGAGIRSAGGAPRQLVYRHGAHELGLVETAPSAGIAARFLWGQLLEFVAGTPCKGAEIELLDDAGAVVAGAMTDEFGEFRLAAGSSRCGAGPRLRGTMLRVDTGGGAFMCRIPPSPSAVPERVS